MDNENSKIGKLINGFNDYLDKLKQEEDHSLAIFYDYDIEPLPNDLVDMANENKTETENDLENALDFKINKWGF